MLTKDNIKDARKELEAALATVQAKTGIKFSVGIIRYDATTMRCKIEGAEVGTVQANSGVDLYLLALRKVSKIALGPKWVEGKSYRSPELGVVKIVGYNSNAFKYPVIVQTLRGKKFKVTQLSAKYMVDAGEVA